MHYNIRFSLLTALCLFGFTAVNCQQLIHSTPSGGNWCEPATWVEGIVPGMNDTVDIYGPVEMIYNQSCHKLIIRSSGSLQSVSGNRYMTVYGDISNHGSLSNSGGSLFLNAMGDIHNAGIWSHWLLSFTGDAIQQIDCSDGAEFQCHEVSTSKTAGHLATTCGVNFRDCFIDLNGCELYIPALATLQVSGNHLRNAVIRGDSSYLCLKNGAYLQYVAAENMILKGAVQVANNSNQFNGSLVVEDTLRNYGSSHHVSINGNLINRGHILNGSSNLTLYISGNIDHTGTWNTYSTNMVGPGTRDISFGTNTTLQSYYFTVDGPDRIIAASDLRFLNTRLNFHYDTLSLISNGLLSVRFTEGGTRYIRNMVIEGNHGYLETHGGAYLENNVLHNIRLRGIVGIGNNNNVFKGNLVVLDTLQNFGASTHNCTVEGSIINNGVIRNGPGYLDIHVFGDIVHNFVWANHTTQLMASNQQHIVFAPDVIFSGEELQFAGSGDLMAGSSLAFEGTRIDLNNDTLYLGPDENLKVHGSGAFLRNAVVSGNMGKATLSGGAYLQDVVISDMYLGGRVRIYGNNIVLKGNIVNHDTIENMGVDHTLVVDGDFTNQGVIRNGENMLRTLLCSNSVNEGCWNSGEIRMAGYVDQHLLFRSDSIPQSPVRLVSGLYGAPFQWYKNGTPVPGAGSPDLEFPQVSTGDYGRYHCTGQSGESVDFYLNSSLSADFSADDSVGCAPFTVQFTDESVSPGTIDTWFWDFGDGETGTAEDPVHSYDHAGEYPVKLLVSDMFGTDSVVRESYIKVNPAPVAEFCFENVILGNPVDFTDLSAQIDSVILYHTQWADTVLSFSSRYTAPPPHPEWWWSEQQILGEPDVYPLYGDYHEAWATLTASGQREFIEVGFPEAARINSISIYETLHPGAIDTVYVISSNGNREVVWSGTAGPMPLEAREFTVDFELTTFEVIAVRIALHTEAVPYWNELDAVSVTGPADTILSPDIHYLWDVGEGGITYTTPGDITHLYSSAGCFDVSLTVDYKNTCFSTTSKTVTVYEPGTCGLDIGFFLEGPFHNDSMLTTLSDCLPLTQPFSQPPWNYYGSEEVAGVPDGAVDWILIDLRRTSGPPHTAIPDSSIGKTAAFVSKDGSLKGTDGITPPRIVVNDENNIYVVIIHRNHVDCMSSVPLEKNGNDFLYQFFDSPEKALGGSNACKEIGSGVWGLIGGDGNADSQVNNGDKNDVWAPAAGSQGYLSADFDMNGQVNNGDKIDLWIPNTGLGGQVPD